ncbi:MAG: signal peptide peptidase SppA, partial [Sphingobacteriales bacterium]
MKEFFKYVFATIVGVFLSLISLFLLFLFMISLFVSSMDDDQTVFIKDKSVLFLNLDQPVLERTPVKSFENIPFIGGIESPGIGFNDIILSLKKAATDDKIKCVYINVSAPQAGMATMREVRDAIV